MLGTVNIPYSKIEEDIDIFDFELTDEEMQKIASLERNEKHDWY